MNQQIGVKKQTNRQTLADASLDGADIAELRTGGYTVDSNSWKKHAFLLLPISKKSLFTFNGTV